MSRDKYFTAIRERALALDRLDDMIRGKITAIEEFLALAAPGCRVEFELIGIAPDVTWSRHAGEWRFFWGDVRLTSAPRDVRAKFAEKWLGGDGEEILTRVVDTLEREITNRGSIFQK